jgi:hypothetical protein
MLVVAPDSTFHRSGGFWVPRPAGSSRNILPPAQLVEQAQEHLPRFAAVVDEMMS